MTIEKEYKATLACDYCDKEVDELHSFKLSRRVVRREDVEKKMSGSISGKSSLTWSGRRKGAYCEDCMEEIADALDAAFS